MKKTTKKKLKKYRWLGLLIISVPIAMYVYGMANHYFPSPIHAGAGQYFDIATGITIVALVLSGAIIKIMFEKKRKKGKK